MMARGGISYMAPSFFSFALLCVLLEQVTASLKGSSAVQQHQSRIRVLLKFDNSLYMKHAK